MKKNKLLSILLILTCFCFLCGFSVKAYEQSALNYNNQGINFTKNGEFDKAIESFKKAVNADPSLTNAYYNLGSVYKHTGKTEKALNAFKLLLRNDPKDDETAYLVADLYFQQKDYDKSLLYLNSIMEDSKFYTKSKELTDKIEEIKNPNIKNVSNLTLAPLTNVSKYTFTNFKGPAGIAENSQGLLYVADFLSDSIQVLTPDGQIKTTITNDLIKGPVGVAIDSKDNVFVANYLAGNIIKISNDNQNVKVFANDITKPYYLYFNRAGVLFVSEQEKNTVIRLGVPE